MKIILSDDVVIATVRGANQIDSNNIVTEIGTFAGTNLSIVDSDAPTLSGHIYRDGKFQQLLDSQELAVKFLTRFMDEFAAIKNYDSIQSAALRAGYPGPFHDEGVKYATWMDGCWAACYTVLDKVSKGQMNVPTESELIALMPPKPEF